MALLLFKTNVGHIHHLCFHSTGNLCNFDPLSKNCYKTNTIAQISLPLCVSVKVDEKYIVILYQAFMFTCSNTKLILSFYQTGPIYTT